MTSDQEVSIRIRHRLVGGHVHCWVYSSEFGPETTHGQNTQAPMIFRPVEFEAFRQLLKEGAMALGACGLVYDPTPSPTVEFISEDPE